MEAILSERLSKLYFGQPSLALVSPPLEWKLSVSRVCESPKPCLLELIVEVHKTILIICFDVAVQNFVNKLFVRICWGSLFILRDCIVVRAVQVSRSNREIIDIDVQFSESRMYLG